MNMKKIIPLLIILLVFSMLCVQIYAIDEGNVSNVDHSNKTDGIYISGSGDVAQHVNNHHENPQYYHENIMEIYI